VKRKINMSCAPACSRTWRRIKRYLWHGNLFQALNELQSLKIALDAAACESKNEHSQQLLKGVDKLHTYVKRNQALPRQAPE
jgi:hypothetical protein